ncbi:MAG: hypothetical protein ACMXYB_01460 [Candidatus Woesearchaeota archaeon]
MEKKAIHEELISVQNKIKDLKKDFFEKKKIKEEFFTAGEEFSEQINSLYEEVKQIEAENNLDEINLELENHKKEYEEVKTQYENLKQVFEETLDKVKSKKKTSRPNDTTNSAGDLKVRRISPQKAQKQLEALEHKVQTQVLSLDKEAEISKEISELKEVASAALKKENKTTTLPQKIEGDNSLESQEFKSIKKEYYDIRKKYNSIEKKIRFLYKQIRLISKDKKQKYKEIDKLRDNKKQAFEEFREHKKTYVELSKNLKNLFKEEERILEELGEDAPSKKKRKKMSSKTNSFDNSKKQKKFEDQLMKKGMTLTTEDLLSFQKRN